MRWRLCQKSGRKSYSGEGSHCEPALAERGEAKLCQADEAISFFFQSGRLPW
jgi:hypothetical protein